MDRVGRLAEELCGALAQLEPGAYGAEAAAATTVRLARAENACRTAKARLAARAAAGGAHRVAGHADPSDWLAATAGSSMREARRELETTVAADRCPETRDALLRGEVSLAQAGEILRTEAEVPGTEAELLGVARSGSLGAVRERGRTRRLDAMPRDELFARQRAARSFAHWRDELGMIRGSFALTPDAGIPFVTAVDAETDRLRRAAKSTGGPFAPRIALAADALRAVVAGRATAAPGLATINLVIDWPALARGHVHSGERSHIIGGGPIPPAVVRELFRNAFVKLVLTDGVKVQRVLHVGRRLPAAVRTALELGPPPEFAGVTCAAPTCERRYGLEWDHKDPVAHGGATTFANMQPLCGMSHRDKTRADRAAGLLDDRRPPRVRAQEPRPVASVDPTVAADPMAGADRGDPAEGRAPP